MAEILKINSSSPEPSGIARAAELLRWGQVVAIPTDTFYGLAANPFNLAAVEQVFSIKGRPPNNPLLLLVDSLEMAAEMSSELPPQFHLLAQRYWPGPLTLVVKASSQLPPAVTAHTGTIGLRLPAAPIAVALIQAAGFALTATSANLTGQAESSSAAQVESSLGTRLPLILDGGISRAEKPSTVLRLDGESWEVLREGSISGREITTFFGAAPFTRKNAPK